MDTDVSNKHDVQISLVLSEINNLKAGQSRILAAIEGDPLLGNVGLAIRVRDVEAEVKRHDKKLIAWGAVIAFIAILIPIIVAVFHKG